MIGINIGSYQWYKNGVAIDDASNTMYVGEDTDTLTIVDVQLEDEAYYTCQIDNSLGIPDLSEDSLVMVKRLIGWWKLDGDLTDSVATVVAGAPVYDGISVNPDLVANGKDGGAISFSGEVDGLVMILDSNDYYNSIYPHFYTISAWVKTTQTSSWGAYIAKQDKPEEGTQRGFLLTHNSSGQAVHTLRQSFNDLGSDIRIDDGQQWHLVTGTYDGTTGEGKIYVDGLLANETTNSGTVEGSPVDLMFGAETPDGTIAYVGLLDDVRMYGYPLNAQEVADLYTDYNEGVWLCLDRPAMDTTGPDGVTVGLISMSCSKLLRHGSNAVVHQ